MKQTGSKGSGASKVRAANAALFDKREAAKVERLRIQNLYRAAVGLPLLCVPGSK